MFSFIVVLLSTSSLNRHRPEAVPLDASKLEPTSLNFELSTFIPGCTEIFSHVYPRPEYVARARIRRAPSPVIAIPRRQDVRLIYMVRKGYCARPTRHDDQGHTESLISPVFRRPPESRRHLLHTVRFIPRTPWRGATSVHPRQRNNAGRPQNRGSAGVACPGGHHTQEISGIPPDCSLFRTCIRARHIHRARPLTGPARPINRPESFSGGATADTAEELTSERTDRDAMRRADCPRQQARGRPSPSRGYGYRSCRAPRPRRR